MKNSVKGDIVPNCCLITGECCSRDGSNRGGGGALPYFDVADLMSSLYVSCI